MERVPVTDYDLPTQVALLKQQVEQLVSLDQKVDSLVNSVADLKGMFGNNGKSMPSRLARVEFVIGLIQWIGGSIAAVLLGYVAMVGLKSFVNAAADPPPPHVTEAPR